MKRCPKCRKSGPFTKDASRADGLSAYCTKCRSKAKKRWRLDNLDQVKQRRKVTRPRDRAKENAWRNAHPEKLLWRYAKRRARENGLPFTISVDDVKAVWPADGLCPVLGIKLEKGIRVQHPGSPTLDAFVPDLGYTPSNVAVISYLANAIKRDVTDPTIIERVALYMRQNIR